jgi:hypothetical protein
MACIKRDPPMKVAAYIDSTTATWNLNELQQLFSTDGHRSYQSIPICTRTAEDFWAWHYEKTGMFSVKSAYRMLINTRQCREE